jgi:aspartate ammonia-lyase
MENISIGLTEVFAGTMALLGFGFTAWSMMLKRALQTLDKLSETLSRIDTRVTLLEQWVDRHVQDYERLVEKVDVCSS